MPETAAKQLFSLETAQLLPRLVPTLRDQIQMLFQASLAIFLIDDLHKELGEEQFTALLATVEPQAHQIVEQALREGL